MRMVRRMIAISLLLMILFFGSQWLVTYLKVQHEIEYDFVTGQTTFQVKETYQKNFGNQYYVEISLGDKVFDYIFPNLFQKKKKIISDIKMVQRDDLLCIYPVLERESSLHNIECSKNGMLYSYQSLKEDSLVQDFVQKLKKDSINLAAWENDSEESVLAIQSTVFPKNILKEDKITVWYYQGIEVLSSSQQKNFSFIDWDKYENKHGVLVDHYYLLPEYHSDRVYDFSAITVVDINTLDFWKVSFPETVSQNTYINGVVDGKVYYLDKDHIVQYEFNPEKRNVRVVGTKELNAQFYNGKWETINIYDLVNVEKKFQTNSLEKVDFKRDDIVETLESGGAYYYYTQSGDFYRVLKNFSDRVIFLFHADNPNNVILGGDTLYYISGDTLYYYDEGFGQRKVIRNNEFLYNKLNRVQVYRESKS